MSNTETHVALAADAGFSTAAKTVADIVDRKARLARAYEHYRYVSQEKFAAFNHALHERTFRHEGAYPSLYEVFDTLSLIPAERYPDMPPADVLEKVKAAKDTGIFDTFEVAKIESTRVYRDPIVFGCINGCTDKFYVASWDDDVRIEDLIADHEG